MIKKSLGLIEMKGLPAAIQAADAALKAADVNLASFHVVGSGYVCIILDGEVAAASAAVTSGVTSGKNIGEAIAYNVIPRPHDEVQKLLTLMEIM